jgi:hypothetical protein
MVVIPFIGGPMNGKSILRERIAKSYIMPVFDKDDPFLCVLVVEYRAKDGAYVFHLDKNGKLWQEQSNRNNLRDI